MLSRDRSHDEVGALTPFSRSVCEAAMMNLFLWCETFYISQSLSMYRAATRVWAADTLLVRITQSFKAVTPAAALV